MLFDRVEKIYHFIEASRHMGYRKTPFLLLFDQRISQMQICVYIVFLPFMWHQYDLTHVTSSEKIPNSTEAQRYCLNWLIILI